MTTATESVHRTTTGLDEFLKNRRAEVDAALTADTPGESNGQSEPGKTSGDSKETTGEAIPGKKEKTAADLKVELSNQAKASLRLGKEKADLQRQLEAQAEKLKELEARAAGTYVEPTEDQKQRETQLRAEFDKFEQRRETSKELAIKEFGEEYVLTNIYQEESPFTKIQKAQPWMTQRILSAEQPIMEALKVVNEEAVLSKFGRTEVEVLKKAEEILRPLLFEQFTQEIKTKDMGGAKSAPHMAGLSRARSAGSDERGSGETVRTFSALNLNPHNRV